MSAGAAFRGVIGGASTAQVAWLLPSFWMKSQIDPSQAALLSLLGLVLRDATEVKSQRDFAKASGKTSITGDVCLNDNVGELVMGRKGAEPRQKPALSGWKPPVALTPCGVGVPKGEEETGAGLGAAVEISSSA